MADAHQQPGDLPRPGLGRGDPWPWWQNQGGVRQHHPRHARRPLDVQCVGEFAIDRALCERLIDLHRDADGLVRRGRMGAGVDIDKKDSYDLIVYSLTPEMVRDYGVARYYTELWGCLRHYLEQHPILKEQVGKFDLTESPVIQ